MDAREQKGLEIAATVKLKQKGGVWSVPCQGDKGGAYRVDLKGDEPTCSCPDHETRRVKCKHIHAVEYSIRRETLTLCMGWQ
ncbi:MAG: SWIM zinc finger family protein [Bryobacteraceae bacterium]